MLFVAGSNIFDHPHIDHVALRTSPRYKNMKETHKKARLRSQMDRAARNQIFVVHFTSHI